MLSLHNSRVHSLVSFCFRGVAKLTTHVVTNAKELIEHMEAGNAQRKTGT